MLSLTQSIVRLVSQRVSFLFRSHSWQRAEKKKGIRPECFYRALHSAMLRRCRFITSLELHVPQLVLAIRLSIPDSPFFSPVVLTTPSSISYFFFFFFFHFLPVYILKKKPTKKVSYLILLIQIQTYFYLFELKRQTSF